LRRLCVHIFRLLMYLFSKFTYSHTAFSFNILLLFPQVTSFYQGRSESRISSL
jgi:hypothetical protein